MLKQIRYNTCYSYAHPILLHFNHVRADKIACRIITCIKKECPQIDIKSAALLDIGSSNGSITNALAKYTKKTVGIDIDEYAIHDGKKRFSRHNLQLMSYDGKKFPFPDNTFDIAVIRLSLSCSNHPSLMTKELFRILKPGGICYFRGLNRHYPFGSSYRIPFLVFFPTHFVEKFLQFIGVKHYFVEQQYTHQELLKFFRKFEVDRVTSKIFKDPYKYRFHPLYKMALFLRLTPKKLLDWVKPLYPTYIWILKKPLTYLLLCFTLAECFEIV